MTKDEMKDRISMALKDPILQRGFDIDDAIQQVNKELNFDKIADEMEQDLKDSEVNLW